MKYPTNLSMFVLPGEHIFRVEHHRLTLFRSQPFLVAGDIYIQHSRFQWARRYYAELRGSTIVVFRNATVARSEVAGQRDIVTVITVHKHKARVVANGDVQPRIYFCSCHGAERLLIYVKVTGGRKELEAWSKGISHSGNVLYPDVADLTIHSPIGWGASGKVFVVRWRSANADFALKVMEKADVFSSFKKFRQHMAERSLMQKAGEHPFLLPLEFAFQTRDHLFIGTPFCAGGDLDGYLKSNGDTTAPCSVRDILCFKTLPDESGAIQLMARISEPHTRRIAAEVILGLEHLHSLGIVHRDLKPKNIFIHKSGHIKIGDFGLARFLPVDVPGQRRVRSNTYCGTRHFIPPEMLRGEFYSFEADMWSLGVMLYRMMCGAYPFPMSKSKEKSNSFSSEVLFPSWLSLDARDLIKGLLDKDQERRLKIPQVKSHSFFSRVDWDDVLNLTAGPSVIRIDIIAGTCVADAMPNFNINRVNGKSFADRATQELRNRLADEAEESIPLLKQNVANEFIGFEYGRPVGEAKQRQPVPVTKRARSRNIWKIASEHSVMFRKFTRGFTSEAVTSPEVLEEPSD